jgi:flavin-binding protein dodecin
MTDHVYKTIEITGSSSKSVEAAVETAVARAAETLHNLRWFEVADIRGHLEGGKIVHWQVTVKIGFAMDALG